MGEIKSTLDLVMERTRHLSLSAEEKEEQRREDFEKRLEGLLQQYADEAMAVDEFRDRMTALEKETGIAGHKLLVAAVLRRIDPDRNNDRWRALLALLEPDVGRPLDDLLAAYGRDRAAILQTGQKQLRDRLARDFGITGKAVVPNPHRDPTIRSNLIDLQHDARTRIAALAG